jgi:hypothetical protein
MPAAAAEALTGVSEAGPAAAAVARPAAEGAVLAGRPVRLGGPSTVPPASASVGQTCDWVRRQLR